MRQAVLVILFGLLPGVAAAQSQTQAGSQGEAQSQAQASQARASQADGGSKADAEHALQAYLAMWSSNAGVTAAAVDRFYAPHVVYYGKRFSRAAVLADKLAYIRSWPERTYREVPGTFSAHCNNDRSRCHVVADMNWRRVNRRGTISTGRARLGFEFVPVDGGRKIARESAKVLSSRTS